MSNQQQERMEDDRTSAAGTDNGTQPQSSDALLRKSRVRRLTQLRVDSAGNDPQCRTELLATSAAPAFELLTPAPADDTAERDDKITPIPIDDTGAAATVVGNENGQTSAATTSRPTDQLHGGDEKEAAAARWRSRKKHLFILSSAGRPIFTRWGNEYEFAELFSLLQTLVSIVETTGDSLRRVGLGSHEMYFFSERELTLVMVAATRESPQCCFEQLKLLHSQMLAVLPNVHQILAQHPGYDVRRMFAAGDIRVMQNLIHRLNNDPGFIFGAPHFLPLAPAVRDKACSILRDYYQGHDDDTDGSEEEGVPATHSNTGAHLYSLLITGNRVAALVQSKDFPLPPNDMLLLINFAYSVLTAAQGEVWAPICLPETISSGYMWCYCRPLRPDVLLVHVATAQTKFVQLSVASSHIAEELLEAGVIHVIEVAGQQPWPEVPKPLRNAGLVHYVYIKDRQLSLSMLPPHVCTKGHRKAFLRKLRSLRDKALGVCTGSTPFLFSSDTSEVITIEVTASGVETYATFLPSTPRGEIQGMLGSLSKTLSAVEPVHLALRHTWWTD